MNTDAKHDLDRRTTSVLGIRAVGPALRFCVQVVLARWLGPTAFGQYAVASTSAELAGNASLVGRPHVILRFVPQYRSDSPTRAALLRSSIVIVGALAIVAGCILWLPPIADRLVGSNDLAKIALIGMPLAAAGLILHEALLTASHRPAAGAALLDIVRPIVLLLSVVAIALTHQADLGWFLFISTAALIATTVVLGVAAWTAPTTDESETVRDQREWRRTAVYGYVAALALLVFYQSDIVIIGLIISPEAAGEFSVAAKLAALGLLPLRAIEATAVPQLTTALSQADRRQAADIARSAQRNSLAIGAVVVLGLLAAGPILLRIFGDDYRDAYPILAILLVGTLANAATGPRPDVVWLAGNGRLHATVLAAHAVANLIGSILAAHFFGVIAVAVITALTGVSWNVIMTALAERELT